MTLLGYFNSLRELGGSRRIVEDEVNTRLTGYVNRKRIGQKDGLFANRTDRLRGGRADLPRATRTRSPRPSAGSPCGSTTRTGSTWRSPPT